MRGFGQVVIAVVLCAGSAIARADQCEVVDADAASWAQKVVTRGVMVAQWCEPCGDVAPTDPQKVATVSSTRDKGGSRVQINGKRVDLAYTYVQTGKSTWANVGMLVGCPMQDGTAIYTGTPLAKAPVVEKLLVELGPEFGECARYVHKLNLMFACPKFPATAKDAMRDAGKQMLDAIRQAPPDARKAMQDGCKAGADAIEQAMKSVGC